MNITLKQAQNFFKQHASPQAISAAVGCDWQMLGGIPHLVQKATPSFRPDQITMHFVKCKCGDSRCSQITSVPGILH